LRLIGLKLDNKFLSVFLDNVPIQLHNSAFVSDDSSLITFDNGCVIGIHTLPYDIVTKL
jgi:hypothetical protein